MSRSQRLTFLAIAAVIAVVAVVVLAGGSEGDDGEQAATPTPTATATTTPESEGMAEEEEQTPTPTPTPTEDPTVLLRPGATPRTVEARQGERVRFRIRSPRDEEMHLHGYDITKPLPAGETVTVTIGDPQLTGIFEIELHGSGEQVGSLKVEP